MVIHRAGEDGKKKAGNWCMTHRKTENTGQIEAAVMGSMLKIFSSEMLIFISSMNKSKKAITLKQPLLIGVPCFC